MKKNKKSFLSRLFSSNIFLLILSFILSFAAWITVSFVTDTNQEVTIDSVPVNISLPESDLDYTYFVPKNVDTDESGKPLVSVKIKGNPLVTSSKKPDDINLNGSIAIASNAALSPQEYDLTIKPESTPNYEFAGTIPSSVKVYVDLESTKDFDIVNGCTFKNPDDSGKTYPDLTLSQSKVQISGPESLINRIASVEVEGVISEEGSVEKELIYLDSNNQPIDGSEYFSPSFDKVTVTAKLLSKAKVTLRADLINQPENVNAVPVITPSAVWIAGEQKELDKLNGKLTITELDFSTLKNEPFKESYTITPPTNCKIIPDENENTAPTKATVTLDLSGYSEKTITKKIEYSKDGYTFSFTPGEFSVTVCGDKDELSDITADDISLSIDFTEDFNNKVKELKSGESLSRQNAKVTLKLSGDYTESWIYGSYTIDQINVFKK